MRTKTLLGSLSTVLIVAAVASLWAVASPLNATCASAFSGEQVVASPAESSAFVSELNRLRVAKGLNALTVDGNLSSVALGWAQHMAGQEGLSHRPNLAAGVTIDWRLLGENVGRAPEVDQMMTTFVNSPSHYKNMVEGSFTHIGVGTVRTPDGLLYTAHEFAYVRAAAPAPTPAPAAAPSTSAAAAPKVTAAPAPVATTAAPATTVPVPVATTDTTGATDTTQAPVAVLHSAIEAETRGQGALPRPASGC